MDIDLHVYPPEWLATPKQTFFYQTIVDALQSPRLSDSQAKSRAIENSTVYLCTSAESRKECQDVMWRFSMVVVAIIWQVPHDHVYQDILADAIISLRKRTEPVAKFGEDEGFWGKWENLPELLMFIMDMRQNPIDGYGEQAPREEITNFQRLTSFTARLIGAGYTLCTNWPAGALSHVLGAPREKGMTFDCGLWIGTEWLLHSADATYIALREWEEDWEFPGGWQHLKPTGSALQKWQAWRQRLIDLEENWDEWEFKETTLERVRQAIQEMETVEQRHAKPAGEEQKEDKCADNGLKDTK